MATTLRLLILLLVPLRAEAQPSHIGVVEIRRVIEAYALERHIRVDSLDPESIVADALARSQAEPAAPAFEEWLRRRLDAAFFTFAPTDAAHDESTRYRLPFLLEIPRYVSQGVGGEFTHQTPEDYHSFDFVMPIGTPVLAARGGRVARVIDGFGEGGLDRSLAHRMNAVILLHDDGTFGVYAHLESGIGLREGALVRAGERLGRSGFTGYGSGPHLHFVVRRRTGPMTQESVPILFGPQSRPGFVPEKNQWYGALPKPTLGLEIRVDGNVIDQETELTVKRGDTLVLEVTRIDRTGQRTDVTSDRLTRYVPMTPWSVDVTGRARIGIAPARGFDRMEDIDRSHGTVAIFHGSPRTGMGVGAVNVSIVE